MNTTVSDFGISATTQSNKDTNTSLLWSETPSNALNMSTAAPRPRPAYPAWLGAVEQMINVYFIPVVMLVGLAGNILIIIVINHKTFRKFSLSVYFTALAVYDNLTLVFFGLYQFVWFAFGIRMVTVPVFCHYLQFILTIATSGANWIVSIIGFDRLVVVLFPQKAKTFSTPVKARIAMVIMTFFSIFYGSPYLWMAEFKTTVCSFYPRFLRYIRYDVSFLNLFLQNILPTGLLIVCYFILVKAVRKSENRVRTNNQNTTGNKSDKLTKCAMYICLFFIILNLPINCYMIVSDQMKWFGKEPVAAKFFITIAMFMKIINHAINIFITIATNTQFRDVARKLVLKRDPPTAGSSSGTGINSTRTTGT